MVLVDARNVLRSRWPNIPEEDLVRRCRAFADRESATAVVVFDGRAPDAPSDGLCTVVDVDNESADDWIAREASRLRTKRTPYWLVTSDRELRARAGGDAVRIIGGGAFAGALLSER